MNHRRSFLKQLAALAALPAIPQVERLESALARLRSERAAPGGRAAPDWGRLAGRYLLDPDVVYLNHGAIGTVPRAVHEAHVAYLSLCETNPWAYLWGGSWEEPREAVRSKAARLMHAAPEEVAITHNTTEGFNVLAQGLPLGPGDEVLFSSLNHPGASICWHRRAPERGFEVRTFDFPVSEAPRLTRDEVLDVHDRAIGPRTRVLVFPHVDNVIGIRHPLRELAQLAHERGVEFVAVDAAQSLGMVEVDAGGSGADFVAASPHKWVQAPKGLGLLYAASGTRESVDPMWVTWGQERWAGTARVFEDYGTRNFPALLALGDALDFQEALGAEAKEARYRELWSWWKAAVDAAPHLEWRSSVHWEISASLFAIERKGVGSGELFTTMNRDGGFVFRPFSSHGLNTVRISPNVYGTAEQIERFVAEA